MAKVTSGFLRQMSDEKLLIPGSCISLLNCIGQGMLVYLCMHVYNCLKVIKLQTFRSYRKKSIPNDLFVTNDCRGIWNCVPCPPDRLPRKSRARSSCCQDAQRYILVK